MNLESTSEKMYRTITVDYYSVRGVMCRVSLREAIIALIPVVLACHQCLTAGVIGIIGSACRTN